MKIPAKKLQSIAPVLVVDRADDVTFSRPDMNARLLLLGHANSKMI